LNVHEPEDAVEFGPQVAPQLFFFASQKRYLVPIVVVFRVFRREGSLQTRLRA